MGASPRPTGDKNAAWFDKAVRARRRREKLAKASRKRNRGK